MRKTLNKKAFLRTALDALGPIVVNKDGSLARISNWGKMTEQEQEATKRCGIYTANCIIIGHFSAFESGLVAPFLYAA